MPSASSDDAPHRQPAASTTTSTASTLVEAPNTNAEVPPAPDLAFPQLTTDTERAGFTSEYRQETPAGLLPIEKAKVKPAAPAPPAQPSEQLPEGLKKATTKYEALREADPEKAAELKDVLLVTWKIDDPVRASRFSNETTALGS